MIQSIPKTRDKAETPQQVMDALNELLRQVNDRFRRVPAIGDTNYYSSTTSQIAGGLSAIRVYSASGDWTQPSPPARKLRVICVGGGGGGGSSAGGANGAGGGAGGVAVDLLDVSAVLPGSTIAFTVGAGGGGGTAGGAGSDGGTTSFGTPSCRATGGIGGSSGIGGGAGGAGNIGDVQITGGPGESAGVNAGSGGSNAYGGGGEGGTPDPGVNGYQYGGGGGGGGGAASDGGAGADGVVIVEEYT